MNNDSEDTMDTLKDEINLTDQLLIDNEGLSGKNPLLNSELLVDDFDGGNNHYYKDPRKRKTIYPNNNETNVINIELGSLDNQSSEKKLKTEEKIESIINFEESIKLKEIKGPILFKKDSRELENIKIWKKIKVVILSICIISGILFYGTLPIIISFGSPSWGIKIHKTHKIYFFFQ